MVVPYDFWLLDAASGEQSVEIIALWVILEVDKVQLVLFVVNLVFGAQPLLELSGKEVLDAVVKVLQNKAFRFAH